MLLPLLAAAACAAAPPGPPQTAPRCTPERFPDDVVALVKKSPFVFRGTVLRAGATAGFTPDASTVIVRVDRLFADRPEDRYVGSEAEANVLANHDAIAGGLAGQEVTLVAKDAPPAPGLTAYFFTESTSWGQSVELREIATRSAPELESVLPRLKKALLDADVSARMARADAVVLAEVTDVGASAPGVNHHDPLWTDATVQPSTSLKGSSGGVTVRFSASNDVCCFTRPKLTKGERAMFILHRGTDGAYYAETGDVLPPADETRLRAVLACPPSLG
jgi:hypothetical protein